MNNVYDYLIIGAGPAGLQLGYFLSRADRDYMILESGKGPGSFFQRFPRHRTLISINKIHTGYSDPEINLRFDWNSLISDNQELLFSNYSKEYFPGAECLLEYLSDYARKFDLNVQYETQVTNVRKKETGEFLVEDDSGGTCMCRRLIVATGVSKLHLPDIPGIESVDTYDRVSVDPEEFVNQHVLIIGKGNSAFETADCLIPSAAVIHVASPTPLNLAWSTHFVGNLRAVNNNFLDTYQLKSQNAVIDATINRISRVNGRYAVEFAYNHADGECETLYYDRVIACTGFRFDDSIFDETCKPELCIDDRFPKQTSQYESVNVPDLFFGGVLTQVHDYKKSTSAFIHGFRYGMHALHRLLELRYENQPWPGDTVEPTYTGLTDAVVRRINCSSALWQMFGVLCDVIVVDEERNEASLHCEVPVKYVSDSAFSEEPHYYVITLEFGKVKGNPFNIQRHPDPGMAERSTFLHPIIRRYNRTELVSELHLLENLYGEWKDPEVHVQPLLDFFHGQLMPDSGGNQSAAHRVESVEE